MPSIRLIEMRRSGIHHGCMSADVSIVSITRGRPILQCTAEAVFAQRGVESIQWLVGVEHGCTAEAESLWQWLMEACPSHVSILWMNPGYAAPALAPALSFLAQSRFVMYLSEGERIARSHCLQMLQLIQGHAWACESAVDRTGLLVDRTKVAHLIPEWPVEGCPLDRLACLPHRFAASKAARRPIGMSPLPA